MNFPPGTILDRTGIPVLSAGISAISLYEGASTADRMKEWGLSSSGPNASAFRNLTTLRKRSRYLECNNPSTKGGINSFVAPDRHRYLPQLEPRQPGAKG